MLIVFVLLACCLSLSSASAPIYIEEEMIEAETQVQAPLPTSLPGTILVDLSWKHEDLAPLPTPINLPTTILVDLSWKNEDLKVKRQDEPYQVKRIALTGSMTTTTKPSTTTAISSSTLTLTLTPTSTSTSGISIATPEPTASLPTPFDQGFSNTTQSCSDFIDAFLANSTFKSCLPFSLLLQTSLGFFQASKSPFLISQTLDATCGANITLCAPYMAALAVNLTSPTNCASDLAASNPLVEQAQLGLKAYAPLYTASCLHNPVTSAYCFTDAITNASSPSDSYIYSLPLNITLPGGSQPTCDSCLQSTMRVFQAATSDRSSAIAGDYVASAQQINLQCGPGFVNPTLAAAVSTKSNTATSATPTSNIGILALAIVVGSWFL